MLSDTAVPEAVAIDSDMEVSMHLLVLSVFRLSAHGSPNAPTESQCTFWCSVLSDPTRGRACAKKSIVSMHLLVLSAFRRGDWRTAESIDLMSQCTFWCSVLSDWKDSVFEQACSEVSMHLLVLSAFRPDTLWKVTQQLDAVASQCTFWCSVLSDPPARLRRG